MSSRLYLIGELHNDTERLPNLLASDSILLVLEKCTFSVAEPTLNITFATSPSVLFEPHTSNHPASLKSQCRI